MGIRKHFEKKSPDQDLKLQDLSLEQEESPELKFDPETEISKTDWQEMKGQLKSDRRNKNWQNFAYQAMSLKILFPDRVSELDLDDSALQGMKDALESDRQAIDWWDQAMRLKILFPDKTAELGLDSAWQGMKDQLVSYRQRNNWYGFADQAMSLNILAADEVKVTDQGLELIMRKEDFKQTKKPRPERKDF